MCNEGKEYVTKDSGEREGFDGGAVRDTRESKGRFDLISPIWISKIMERGETDVRLMSKAIIRLAGVMERGAAKYEARNWEKGMNTSRCFDSAVRHLWQYADGADDEDHAAHSLFNIMAIVHFIELAQIEEGYGKWIDINKYHDRVYFEGVNYTHSIKKAIGCLAMYHQSGQIYMLLSASLAICAAIDAEGSNEEE